MKTIQFLALIILTILFQWSFAQPGTLDQSFTPPTSGDDVWSSYIQSDDKILVGRLQGLTRLNYDGSIDPTFIPSGLTGGAVISISEQSDGKFIVAGGFSFYHGVPNQNLIRIEANGAKDNSFTSGILYNSGQAIVIYATAIQPDGKIIIAGDFTTYNGVPVNRIARLNPDGSLDNSFDAGTGPNILLYSVAIQPDGKILIGGIFSDYNGIPARYISRLNQDGSLDMTFNSGNAGIGPGSHRVSAITLQSDNKILVGGEFSSYNGTTRWCLLRLNADGTLDLSFDSGTGARAAFGFPGIVNSIMVQHDDKILIGGNFTTYNGTARSRIARINSDGTLDHTFTVGTGANGLIKTVSLQNDGKVIIGGGNSFILAAFTQYNGTPVNSIARLLTDVPISISHTTSNYNGYEISCHGGNNGSIDLTISGGTPPYTFNWNNGTYATQNLAAIPEGTYHVVVTDANNSTAEATIVLSEPNGINITIHSLGPFGDGFITHDVYDIWCKGDSTGWISGSAFGGVFPYTYNWNNGAYSTKEINNLGPGIYSLEVTDANNCTGTASYTVTEPEVALELNVSNDTFVFVGGPNGSECVTLQAAGTGGISQTGQYFYSWSASGMTIQSFFDSTSSINFCPINAGDVNFTVVVTDGLCPVSKNILVRVYNAYCGNNYEKVQVCINGSQTVCLTQNAANNVLANNPNAQLGSCAAYKTQDIGSEEPIEFGISPNPTSGRFVISIRDTEAKASLIQVFGSQGNMVLSIPVADYADSYQAELDLSAHADGVYFIKVQGENAVLHTEKIVKMH